MVQIDDKQFEIFIAENEINGEVKSLARQISTDYNGENILFIALLNGAFMFASDLMKEITIPVSISFAKLSSYHGGTSSSGIVKELIGVSESLKGRHIVIIEDIVDTGNTIDSLMPSILAQEPESVKVCTLLFKPEAFKGIYKPDYVGFAIPNAFVVGYGLDYNELGRNLKAIYQLKK